MRIKCRSCGENIPVEWEEEGTSQDSDPVITSLEGIVLCGTCLDKVPNKDTVNFFRHLTVEIQAIKNK